MKTILFEFDTTIAYWARLNTVLLMIYLAPVLWLIPRIVPQSISISLIMLIVNRTIIPNGGTRKIPMHALDTPQMKLMRAITKRTLQIVLFSVFLCLFIC